MIQSDLVHRMVGNPLDDLFQIYWISRFCSKKFNREKKSMTFPWIIEFDFDHQSNYVWSVHQIHMKYNQIWFRLSHFHKILSSKWSRSKLRFIEKYQRGWHNTQWHCKNSEFWFDIKKSFSTKIWMVFFLSNRTIDSIE